MTPGEEVDRQMRDDHQHDTPSGSEQAPQRAVALRRLKWLGVGLPIVGLIAIETFRYLFIADAAVPQAEHVALAAFTAIGVVGFGLFMFFMIERAERQIVRQNRELTAINAVSTAVQGELEVAQIIDAALHTVLDRTHATEASLVVFPHDGQPDSGLERKVVRATHASAEAMGVDQPHLIDIPLTRGTTIVGRMRLHLPEGAPEPDLLASTTLQNIGHQLACSIQIGQLVADLQRRKIEGHGLYDILLRISNQNPLPETLAAVVSKARDLLHADDAVMCLNAATSAAVLSDAPDSAMATLADGSRCIAADADRFAELGSQPLACSVHSRDAMRANMRMALASPDQALGELWVGRAAEMPSTARDRGYLHTLGELAAIAITSARMRESQHQAAILAERDRIAREMHDSLAQVLGVTHLRLRALRPKVEPLDAPAVVTELIELADITEEAYRDVREAILGLRESTRIERGLFESLRAFLEKYSHQSGIHTTFETDLSEDPRLAPKTEVQLIRVIQEALTNVRKHATATCATVRVTRDAGVACFVIQDDGRGFDLAGRLLERESGFGLHSMRERMKLIGGTLSIDSAPGRGTRIVARVPEVPGPSPLSPEVMGARDGAEPDWLRPVAALPHPAGR